jgi:hypothetical protein
MVRSGGVARREHREHRRERLPNPYAPPLAEIYDPAADDAGSWIVQIVGVGFLLGSALWSPFSYEPMSNRLVWYAVQVLTAAALSVLLARGVAWVRWPVVAVCALIGVEQLYSGSVLHGLLQSAAAKGALSPVYWIVFAVGALHFALAALLVLPRSVRDFYASAARA